LAKSVGWKMFKIVFPEEPGPQTNPDGRKQLQLVERDIGTSGGVRRGCDLRRVSLGVQRLKYKDGPVPQRRT
jgi:hypothetical protein